MLNLKWASALGFKGPGRELGEMRRGWSTPQRCAASDKNGLKGYNP